MKRAFFITQTALCLASSWLVRTTSAETVKADAVVAADGSEKYKTVQEAINASPQTPTAGNPWVILVRSGTYKELVYVQREKRFVHLVGEDAEKTILTFDLNAA